MTICQKLDETPIDQENIWANDQLSREKIASDFTKIIENIEQPFVISINSTYGTGKSFFLKRWEAQLKKEGKLTIFFNTWDTDFQKDPLLPLISVLLEQLPKPLSKKIEEKAKSMLTSVKDGLNLVIQYAPQIATAGVMQGPKKIIDEVCQVINPKQTLNEYEERKKLITDFKKSIEEVATTQPIYIFVDEIERCRPTYAVELLEIIKHLFNIKGVVFILATDREQLKHTVSNLYGVGMDSDGYLKRFIDLELTLPEPNRRTFCQMLTSHFKIQNETAYDEENFTNGWTCFRNYFSYFSDIYKLSLREMTQCYTQINIIQKTFPDKSFKLMQILSWLVILKHKRPMVYKDIEEKSYDELKEICEKDIKDLTSKIFKSFRASLMAITVSYDEFTKRKDNLKERNDACNIKKGKGINVHDEEIKIAEMREELNLGEERCQPLRDARIMLDDKISPIKWLKEKLDYLSLN